MCVCFDGRFARPEQANGPTGRGRRMKRRARFAPQNRPERNPAERPGRDVLARRANRGPGCDAAVRPHGRMRDGPKGRSPLRHAKPSWGGRKAGTQVDGRVHKTDTLRMQTVQIVWSVKGFGCRQDPINAENDHSERAVRPWLPPNNSSVSLRATQKGTLIVFTIWRCNSRRPKNRRDTLGWLNSCGSGLKRGKNRQQSEPLQSPLSQCLAAILQSFLPRLIRRSESSM
ncbi:hypothetical protein SAMN04488512_11075 [Sulfitobacter litoralis]|uniref:Transposase IS66 family protein n=1 Tax=Sulfitobacter litoralis TaxID=335975 RepID=A0ABY0SEJ2_9RHOB|nr:hypothetical protein SAMN04488512_11075 [Sulfitobacter litoralis]